MPETSTLVQATKVSVNAATSGTKAFTDPLVAGNLIIVAVAVYDPAGGTSVIITAPTDTQSNDYIACNAEWFMTTNYNHQRVWYAIAKSSAACTVTVGQTHSSGVYLTAILAEFDHVAVSPSMTGRSVARASSGTTADSGSIETDAGVLVLGFGVSADGANPATFTEGGSFQNVEKETNGVTNQVCALEYWISTGGEVSATYTINDVRWSCDLQAFLPVETAADGWTAPTVSDSGVTTGAQSAIGFPEIRPNVIYDAAAGTSGQTVVPFLGGTTGKLAVVVYDHNTSTWQTPQLDIDTPTVNLDDGHKSPAIVLGGDGKYHLFWGCHNQPLQYVRSTNAHDPTAWSPQSDLIANATYPTAWVSSGGTILLFYRAGIGHAVDWSRIVSTDHGANWGSPVAILDGTAANAWYCSSVQAGDDVHVIVTWEDETNSLGSVYPPGVNRYGVYHFSITDFGGTETYIAADGTTLTLPITKTDLDAHCVVRAAAYPLRDDAPRIAAGLDGKPAILSARGTDINHGVSFLRSTGSAWTSPVTVCASGVDCVSDAGALVNTASDCWSAFVIRRGTTGYTGDIDGTDNPVDVGGALYQYDSVDNGVTWAYKGCISTRAKLNYVADVQSGVAPIQFLVADFVDMGAGNGNILGFVPGTPTAALTGTALAGITEADLVAGGNTVIVTVTGDTFIPA